MLPCLKHEGLPGFRYDVCPYCTSELNERSDSEYVASALSWPTESIRMVIRETDYSCTTDLVKLWSSDGMGFSVWGRELRRRLHADLGDRGEGRMLIGLVATFERGDVAKMKRETGADWVDPKLQGRWLLVRLEEPQGGSHV